MDNGNINSMIQMGKEKNMNMNNMNYYMNMNYGMNCMNQMMMNQNNMMINQMGMMNNINEKNINENNELNSKKQENSLGNMTIIFKKRGKFLSIQCLKRDKNSDIIHKYRKKSNDYDEEKFFLNDRELFPSSNELLQNNTIIQVVVPYCLKAGGIPILFSDVSKNKTKEIKCSKNGPSYRYASKGINIFGICNYKKCKAYKQEVVVIIKKRKFDLIKERDDLFCPECGANIIPKAVGFYLCKYKIYGTKIEEYKIVPFDNDIDEANNKDSLKYFDPELNGEITMIELIFEVIEYL